MAPTRITQPTDTTMTTRTTATANMRTTRLRNAPNGAIPGLGDRAGEGVPDALLHRGRSGPALLDAAADNGHLVRVELRRGLEHLKRLFARGVLAPVEHG